MQAGGNRLNPFSEVRFCLSGFDLDQHTEVKAELVRAGAVFVPQYGPKCNHVIVHNLTIDDPICVRAMKDKKVLVTSLWVDHSLEAGAPWDTNGIIYRPPKDLNGIPGAQEFVISLTNFQRPLRDDVMTMVSLMGAEFSPALNPMNATHLVCYKFEGGKYIVAKRFPRIKVVNHRWLEDCLKAWKILPEEQYSKSSYELEMMETVVKDSQEETGDVAESLTEGQNINAISNLQCEMGGLQPHSVTSSKVSGPCTLQKVPNSGTVVETQFPLEDKPRSNQALKSRNLNQMDQCLPRPSAPRDQEDAKSNNIYAHNVFLSSDQIGNEPPSTSGNGDVLVNSEAGKLADLSCSKKTPTRNSSISLPVGEDLGSKSKESSKRLADFNNAKCSPAVSRKSPRSSPSLQTAQKLGNSDGRWEQNLAADVNNDLCNSNLESGTEKGISACVGLSTSKQIGDSGSRKRSPLSSRRSSLCLQNAERSASDGKLQENLAEKVVDMCTSDQGLANDKAASGRVGLSSVGAGSLDGKGPGGLLPEKRKVDDHSNVSHGTPKSQKLSTSASKRIDATEPTTPVSSPLEKGHVSFNPSDDIGETAKLSSPDISPPNVSSVKSKAKSSGTSRNLASEMQQRIKSTTLADMTSPNSSNFAMSASPGIGNKKAEKPQQQMISSGTKDLEMAKPASPKLNADDQTNSSVSKPTRKKTVARKTLGSRPKLTKRSAATQKVSNSFQDDAAMQSVGQMEENRAASFNPDKLMTDAPTVDAAVDMGPKPVINSGNEISDCLEPLEDETEAQPELNVQNEKSVTGDISRLAETRSRVEAEATLSPSDKLCEQRVPAAETGNKKQKLATQKKGVSGKTKKKTALAAKESPDGADKEVGAESSKEPVVEKEQALCAPGKKRCGTSDEPVEVGKETKSIVNNDQGKSKVGKHTGKLTGKKRRGTLLLNKSEDPVEVEGENETNLGRAEGEDKDERRNLADKSNVTQEPVEADKENHSIVDIDQGTSKGRKPAGKLLGKKRRGTLVLNKSEGSVKEGKENESPNGEKHNEMLACNSNLTARKSDETAVDTNPLQVKHEPAWFLLSGHKLQRKEFQKVIRNLKGKLCRDSHQWSYQATHFIVPDPLRRTEKFFAAAASGRWILKTDYLTASSQAGRFLPEEAYEWHKNGLSEDGAINLEAPRKWRLLREKTGHGAFYGMRIIVYGECVAPPLDTLKRVVKAGDGTILATSPPYNRFLKSGVDFAIVSPGMPRVDVWVQEFLRHEIPCVLADYLVEYVCKPGYSLDKHVQYNTHEWAAKSFKKLTSLSEECVTDVTTPDNQVSDDLACQVCGSSDRADVMLVCGDESGSTGCGVGTHIDCCDPPLEDVPEDDWFCPKCSESRKNPNKKTKKKAASKK